MKGFTSLHVATVPTACGIETAMTKSLVRDIAPELQQYLPLAVLKLSLINTESLQFVAVATVPTACGIETMVQPTKNQNTRKVATVPTACGIETKISQLNH